jgi:predicted DNA-binding ribbon-helix-helix protein
MLYIMRRTQLYLDEQIWNVLHVQAKSRKTTISELVREAVRERYLGKRDEVARAMREFVGSRSEGNEGNEALDVAAYVRGLRTSSRADRLRAE